MTLNRNGFPIYDGKVELCAGHTREQQRRRLNGAVPHLSLNWKAVEQAVTLQESRR